MIMSVGISEIKPEDTQVRSGEHHQIWIGPSATAYLIFPSDAEMLAWVTDLYGKTLVTMPDSVIEQDEKDRHPSGTQSE